MGIRIKPVVQLESTGCGIASVAAIVGLSYAQAKRIASTLGISARDERLWSENILELEPLNIISAPFAGYTHSRVLAPLRVYIP